MTWILKLVLADPASALTNGGYVVYVEPLHAVILTVSLFV